MFLIPQMLTDETLRARYGEAIRRKSVLKPANTTARELKREIADVVTELEEEIADLVREHLRKGLQILPEPPQESAQLPPDATQDALRAMSQEVLRAQLDEASKNLCTMSVRSKLGKQLKREITALEHELRRRGLSLPIDEDIAHLK